jgi:hypothetical protein
MEEKVNVETQTEAQVAVSEPEMDPIEQAKILLAKDQQHRISAFSDEVRKLSEKYRVRLVPVVVVQGTELIASRVDVVADI